jgi:hypothetical protein
MTINSGINVTGTCSVCGVASRLGFKNPDGSRDVRCTEHQYAVR